jgi:sarcosine oxidase subunit alpha
MRHPDIEFRFEGRLLRACEGDTIAAALIANGVHVFGRSSKYHRPRGYRCGQGHCSACAMRVDGLPGVRTCITPVRPRMIVEREHAVPSADLDVMRVAELFSPLMPPGFYYRWFRRSPALWALLERGLARVAGQGRLPSREAAGELRRARCERRRGPQILVVGGGPAGLSAAAAAADAGAEVVLVERDDRLGGRALGREPLVERLIERLSTDEDIELLTNAEAIGWYEEGVVAVDRTPDLLILEPQAVVLATGGYDAGLPFPDWDLPGVMFATAAQRLLDRHGVRPGSRAVVLTADDDGYDTVRYLSDAGVEIACIADCRRPQQIRPAALGAAMSAGVTVVTSTMAVRAHGFNRVRALSLLTAEVEHLQRYHCDLVCISAGIRPADDLARQAMSHGSLVLRQSDTAQRNHDLWLAGLVNGAVCPGEACDQGREAGAAAASHALGKARATHTAPRDM